MSDRGGGRARGRSRARSQAQPEPVRRPGEPTPTPRMPPQQQPPPQAAAPPPPAGRVARGTAHGDTAGAAAARPGEEGGGLQVKVSRSDNGNSAKRQRSSEPVSTDTSLASTVSESLRLGDNGARGGGRGAWRGRDAADPHTRPSHVTDKRGSAGNATSIMANYFRVTSTPNWHIYQHHVEFQPEIEGTRQKRALVFSVAASLGTYLFDGMTLYRIERFPNDDLTLVAKKRTDGSDVVITIKLVKELPPTDPVLLQVLGIQIRKAMRQLDFQQLNEYYYDKHSAQLIPNHNLELWPGFATAIHQHEDSIMLCADLVFKILRQETVLDQLRTFANRNPRDYRGMAEKELIGCIIMTRYNNKTYKLDEIAWDKKPTDTFVLKNGQTTTFVDYFKNHWNLDIFDHMQPLLLIMPKKRDINRGQTNPMLLIPELCIMTGLSEETRGNFSIMKDIATHTRVDPGGRVNRLGQFMNRMLSEPKITEEMTGWGLAFSRELITFQGRTLPPEKILQAQGKVFSYDAQSADWTKEMRSNKLLHCINIERWALLFTQRDSRQAGEFQDTLYRVCPPMGIQLGRAERVVVASERLPEYMQALNSVTRRGDMQLVVVVVPNNRKDRYDAIKKHCCIDSPVASQVVLQRTISKQHMLMSVSTKIAIQLNCKLGGSAWAVEVPLKNLMVIGYDSYHDSSKKGLSVGAICCSFNNSLTQYYSQVKFQVNNQEMADGLKLNIINAVRHYHKVNNQMPDRIIIYRDGIGVGDLNNIKDQELPQVLSSFKEVGPNFEPRLTFIVVNKRICTRLFEKQGSQCRNPTPGTVVDHVITRPEFYDFFLVSQAVRQGTVTPTQYNIIHDTSGLKPDHIQRLTYKLTHLYYNWPGTIRVPAPCLYAHKLAFLTGQSLHQPPHGRLADTLFFL